jgi:uncharacterized membrane protein YeaQ/YmgE (transglycosylase-associated protein family)
MTTEADAVLGAPPAANRRSDRARRVLLILALAWVVVFPIALRAYWAANIDNARVSSGILLQGTAGLVGAIPLTALLAAFLVRPNLMRPVFWFLPLYFGVGGLAHALSRGIELTEGFVYQQWFGGLIEASPSLLLAIGLWICRPKRAEEPVRRPV